MTPTLIRRVGNGASYYGVDAANRTVRGSYLQQNFKMNLESSDSKERQEARDLTEEFFKWLAETYREQSVNSFLGDSDDEEITYVSYPVKWKKETREFLMEAARKAGFPNVKGMDEAQAAIQAAVVRNVEQLLKKNVLKRGQATNVLLLDMGAGTTDLVLCRCVASDKIDTEFLCTWPKESNICFGGREIDALLMEYMYTKVPKEHQQRVATSCGLESFKAWKENLVSPTLERNETIDQFNEIESIANYMGFDIEPYALNREKFEDLTRNYLQQFPQLIDGCLKEGNLSPESVDMVILTGGHSQWYFVKQMLQEKLPRLQGEADRIVSIALPQETVAVGLTYSGLEKQVEKRTLVYCPPVAATCIKGGSREYWKDSVTGDYYEDVAGTKKISTLEFARKIITPKANHSYVLTVENGEPGQRCTVCGKLKKIFELTVTAKPQQKPEAHFEPQPEETIDTQYSFESAEANYVISKYRGTAKRVDVPDNYRGRSVVGIMPNAFQNTGVTHVTIPNSIKKIPRYCFQNCSQLQKVTMHNMIREIDRYAFADCPRLSILDFGEGCEPYIIKFPRSNLLYIADSAFSGDTQFKEATCSRRTARAGLRNFPAVFQYDGEAESLKPSQEAEDYANGSNHIIRKAEEDIEIRSKWEKRKGNVAGALAGLGISLSFGCLIMGMSGLDFDDLTLSKISFALVFVVMAILGVRILKRAPVSNKRVREARKIVKKRPDAYFNDRPY